jgi:DNA-binding transcriptional ArsR family regulator
MDQSDALAALGALAHETRLSVFRLLVTVGPDGLAAGTIAERLNVLPNTLSTHLAILSRAGLIEAARKGRSVRYRANYAEMRELMGFLMRDCCAGSPEICGPIAEVARRAGAGACGPAADAAPPADR